MQSAKKNPYATDNMEKIKNNKNKMCEQPEDLVKELRNGLLRISE
jgi:hypothetical protein